MPGKQRFRRDERLEFRVRPTPKDLGPDCQPYRLFVGESKLLPEGLLLEHAVLFKKKIVNDRLLLSVQPARQGDKKKLERLYDVCHSTSSRLNLS